MAEEAKKLIQFKNIIKTFEDGTVVLKGISLDIYENEFVTLLTGATRQRIHAGESFCLHPRTSHMIRNEGKHTAKLIWVTDPPNF